MSDRNLDGPEEPSPGDDGSTLLDAMVFLAEHRRRLMLVPLLVGVLTAGLSFLIPPTYTARTSFLPPISQQGGAASALASLGNLGALGGLAGATGSGLRTSGDQYVSLLQSVTISDRIIDQFKLMDVYSVDMRMKARKALASRVQMAAGRKDNLITIEVDDHSPERAAEMANRYVDELKRLTGQLALTEAQQRRAFFEQQLNLTRQKLTAAQQALLSSGYTENAMKAEPKAAAEGYAKLRAELTSAEVRLQALRSQFRDQVPEVEQQSTIVAALRRSISEQQQQAGTQAQGPDYVSKYREFKYQETLFDLFARQYEVARVDEAREGAAIQVVDMALPPEFKSKPSRALLTLGAMLLALLLTLGWTFARQSMNSALADPANADRLQRLRVARGRA
jgi:uncharacterized protein involved in exopolysaccharide biosynthesis